MKTTTLLILMCLSLNAWSQNYIKSVYFSEGDFSLSDAYQKELNYFFEQIKDKNIILSIESHTNNTGTHIANALLSANRSNEVYQYFLLKGIPENRLTITNYGETNPTYDNTWTLGRKMNRRVDLIAQNYQIPDTENDSDLTIKELFKTLSNAPDEFCFKNEDDTIFITSKNTLVQIPKNGFDVKNYQKGDCIKVFVEEFFNKGEILMRGLTTTASGEPMISAGMMNIYAEYKGQKLLLNPEKNMTIVRENIQNFDEDLLVFEGTWPDSTHVDWKLPDSVNANTNPGIARFSNCWFSGTAGWSNTTDKKCPFFFCKIRKYIRLRFLPYQDTITKNRRVPNLIPTVANNDCLDKMNKYGVKDFRKLKAAMEKAFANNSDSVNIDDLQFYMYNLAKTGWSNLDWIMKIDQQFRKSIKVNISPDEFTDCKLVFERYNTILPAIPSNNNYVFHNVPINKSAQIIVIKTRGGKIKLATKKIYNTTEVFDLDFEEVDIATLKQKLSFL